jgi:hypothetical protein
MLWETEGRWQPAALVLVRIDDRKITPQMNLLKNVQDAILIRTRTADPKRYAAAKEWNKGSGSAFPDGFTVNVRVEGDKARGGPKENVRGIPIALPFKVHAELTSNPKRLHCPANAQLDAALDGIVKRECRFAVTHFQLRNKPFENATSDSWLELTDPTAAGAAPLDYGDLVSLEGELITQAERGATAYVVRLKKPISIRPLGDLPAEDKVGEVRLFVSDKLDPSNVMASAPPSAKFHVCGVRSDTRIDLTGYPR